MSTGIAIILGIIVDGTSMSREIQRRAATTAWSQNVRRLRKGVYRKNDALQVASSAK